MNTIAIDLGGTRVKMGVVSKGQVLKTTVVDANAQDGLKSLIPKLEEICFAWIKQYDSEAVGIAFPSLVDVKQKKILGEKAKYPDFKEVDLKDWAEKTFHLPMVLDNDANLAALGENAYGCAADTDNFILLTLGTGIGTAAVMNGQLIRGKHFQAGNLFGHVPLKIDGRKCIGCSGIGCAEAQASTWALPLMIRESKIQSPLKSEPTVDFKVLQKYYDKGDKLAVSVFEECCAYWGNCVIAMIYAYDPDVVIFSGGVIKWGDELIDKLTKTVKEHAWTSWGELEFRTVKNPEHSVLLGLNYFCEKNLSNDLSG
ncbi:MAG: ROK family protein [Clostridiales bacterium]|nr:ROK family protein [Clostridiales bacterium]